jgi:hypothetical protein
VGLTGPSDVPPISGAGLSLFFQEPFYLRQVTLNGTALNEDQCLAVATMSRLVVELIFGFCSLANDLSGCFVRVTDSKAAEA